jgi:hypothetical protein
MFIPYKFYMNRIFFLLMDPFRPLVGALVQGISPVPRTLSTHRTTYTNTEKRRHTSMLRAGFEPAIPMFERQKRILASDRATIETALNSSYNSVLYNITLIFAIKCNLKIYP